MHKEMRSGLPKLFNWILWMGIFLTPTQCTPVTINSEKRDYTIGPCVWVTDRQCPDNDIKFYLFTRSNLKERQFVQIDTTLDLSNISLSHFNAANPTKVIIHGYNSDMFLQPLILMKDEYLQRGDYNLFFVDWSVLAPGPCYPSSVHNAKHAGKCIAQMVQRLIDSGMRDIHLIGFSLGAQVTNFVANALKDFKLPRITGLDPAMPLFITASDENKLDKSDAEFVDVIHTNAFVQGKIERCGHVDFYMNGGVTQPGCWSSGDNPFACSHHRAPEYFSESIRSLKGFWGWSCSSYMSYIFGMCPPTNYQIVAGEDCKSYVRGMFMVTTNAAAPYAQGRWTDVSMLPSGPDDVISSPFKRYRPQVHKDLDEWGKIEGSFNNIDRLPTPFPQDPNGNEWPYFNSLKAAPIGSYVAGSDDSNKLGTFNGTVA